MNYARKVRVYLIIFGVFGSFIVKFLLGKFFFSYFCGLKNET